MIIIVTAYFLFGNVYCQEVYEDTSDVDPSDVKYNFTKTQLYSVSNTTTLPAPHEPTLPTEPSLQKDVSEINKFKDQWIESVAVLRSNERPLLSRTRSNNDATSWKIDAAYSKPKIAANREIDNNVNDSKEIAVYAKGIEDNAKPFKPSPPLQSFYDIDGFDIPPKKPDGKDFTPIIKDDFRDFREIGDSDDFREFGGNSFSKPYHGSNGPIDNGLGKFPYKFEKQIPKSFHKWGSDQLEPKPTATAPASIPAGGLYKVPFALHNKRPQGFQRDHEFELFHEDFQEHKPKKKSNPWKGLVHLVTALIPVGLIVSALSPNVVTIETPQGRSKYKRSVDEALTRLPLPLPPPPLPWPQLSPPAESCRRRILCELYASPRARDIKPQLRDEECWKFTCADPRVAAELVAWVRLKIRGGGNFKRHHSRTEPKPD